MLDNRPYTFDRVVRGIVTIVIFVGLIRLMGYLSDVLVPFAVALLLAYLLNPLVGLVSQRIKNHTLAVLLTLVSVFALTVIITSVLVPIILAEISNTGRIVTQLVNNSEFAARAEQVLPDDIWSWIHDQLQKPEIQQYFKSSYVKQLALNFIRKVIPGVWGVVTGTTSIIAWLFGLFTIALYMVFLLFDFNTIQKGWKNLIPPGQRESIAQFALDFSYGMNRYFRGQAIVAGIVGVLFALGFWMIGLPMGILLGFFIGVLNMVPYLQLISVPVALFFGIVHALELGTNIWGYLGIIGGIYIVVQLVQDLYLTPKIMGKITGFSPAIILLSLSVWGKLLGVLGLIIALPMTALIYAYYCRYFIHSMPDTAALTDESTAVSSQE